MLLVQHFTAVNYPVAIINMNSEMCMLPCSKSINATAQNKAQIYGQLGVSVGCDEYIHNNVCYLFTGWIGTPYTYWSEGAF